ncbi:hypothetical protein [Oceanobacillus bengalensis]|uniref:Uncharacterized protein n=1 Tax=Oceanobacillus bengalensis TaxID=1435466 RepID=A0A494YZ75_9BACI|nr:hypothetical protein [Oceanobacillus bengalensis]RKQ15520.1 hypothetical protein D8M05_09625 [Oceanobacillus bengalensis]
MHGYNNNAPINHVGPQGFDHRSWGITPLTAGLIGAGLGFIGGELFDGPGFGPGPGPGYGYGPGPWYGYGPGYGFGPGFGPYPAYGYGYGGYNPGFY